MLRVRLRLNNIEEVEKWVMGFGAHATVVRPNALRERLRKTAVEVAKRYEEAMGDACCVGAGLPDVGSRIP
jgi:predicted DNA-binding transcriptional regulator YafY